MTNKTFKVSGTYSFRRGTYPFVKTVTSENEESAREVVFCVMGSNHKLKRGEMEVTGIEAVSETKAKAVAKEIKAEEPEPQKPAAPEPTTPAPEPEAPEQPEQPTQ
ncbi:MAG: 50S ribosomal protein L18Ae [Candidatus Undinarchaeales archaeon]|jgi:ribosomal protein L20A (L18A)|nr:50S ribosomal protein L18Ae [Candidatus Undinarchaeales archaeon]